MTLRARHAVMPVCLGLAASLLAACGAAKPAEPDHQVSYTAEKIEASLPDIPGHAVAWSLPSEVLVAGYGVSAGANWAVFGLSDGRAGLPGATDHGRYAVMDLRTGDIRYQRSVEPGRDVSVVSVVSDIQGKEYVVRREAGPDPDCEGDQDDCWVWELYAQALPSGKPRLIASDDRPAAFLKAPLPAAGLGQVFWLQEPDAGDRPDLMGWRPGDDHARLVAAHQPWGSVSAVGSRVLIGADGVLTSENVTLDARTGELAGPLAPPGTVDPALSRAGIAYVRRQQSAPDRLMVHLLGRPKPVEWFSAARIDRVVWLDDSHLLVKVAGGYRLVAAGADRKLPIDEIVSVRRGQSSVALTDVSRDAVTLTLVSSPDEWPDEWPVDGLVRPGVGSDQWMPAPGLSLSRWKEAATSASASIRPTHSAPSTDLPGSRSL